MAETGHMSKKREKLMKRAVGHYHFITIYQILPQRQKQ